jgi:hypothetical protein
MGKDLFFTVSCLSSTSAAHEAEGNEGHGAVLSARTGHTYAFQLIWFFPTKWLRWPEWKGLAVSYVCSGLLTSLRSTVTSWAPPRRTNVTAKTRIKPQHEDTPPQRLMLALMLRRNAVARLPIRENGLDFRNASRMGNRSPVQLSFLADCGSNVWLCVLQACRRKDPAGRPCPRSVDCTTAANDGPPETLPSLI